MEKTQITEAPLRLPEKETHSSEIVSACERCNNRGVVLNQNKDREPCGLCNHEMKELGNVDTIFELFQLTVNPVVQYGNKTQRKAVDQLIKAFGFKTVLAAAKYAISIQEEPHAPVITTPYHLLQKWAQLVIHKKRADGKNPMAVVV